MTLLEDPAACRQAAELRARGLSLDEIGQRMGITKQAVHQLLGFRGPAPRPQKTVTCLRRRRGDGPDRAGPRPGPLPGVSGKVAVPA